MKKIILFVITFALGIGYASAKRETAEEALTRALQQLSSNTSAAKGMTGGNNMTLSCTGTSDDGTTLYYVYSTGTDGFLIASADTRATAVLGYTDNGTFDSAKRNPAFLSWLENCTGALKQINNLPEVSSTGLSTGAKSSSLTSDLPTEVPPLMGDTICWGQEDPYRALCPLDMYTGERSLTGCLATAIAQVMKYYQYPSQTTGGSYTNSNDPNQTVNYDEEYYDWNKILPSYKAGSYQEDEGYEVAKLMRDAGCALDMIYSSSASSAAFVNIPRVLNTYFKFGADMEYCDREFYTTEGWNEVLKTSLANRCPVLFGAQGTYGGHEFILDGYRSDGLYHVNWGWDGENNGYFCVNYLNEYYPEDTKGISGDYCCQQNATVNASPDPEGTRVGKHNLRMEHKIEYDPTNDQVYTMVSNNSCTPFDGTVSMLMLDIDGNIVERVDSDFSQLPLYFQSTYINFSDASNKVKEGYTFKVVYYEYGSAEPMAISTPLDVSDAVIYQNSKFQMTDNACAKPTLVAVEPVLAMKYYAPRIQVKLHWDESNKVEFNLPIEVLVYGKSGAEYCFGTVQPYLKPGQDTTLVVTCAQSEDSWNKTYDDIKVGMTYYYKVFSFTNYGNVYIMKKDMPLILSDYGIDFDNFNIDNTVYCLGDTITGTLDVINSTEQSFTDGFYMTIFSTVGNDTTVVKKAYCDAFVTSYSTTPITLKIPAPDEGRYFAQFSEAPDYPLGTYGDLVFDVVKPTGITEVASEGKKEKKSLAAYNIAGQVVSNSYHGIVILNGKKLKR